MPNAAQVIVERLIANGVDHVFCVPGESYLAVLDDDLGGVGHGPGLARYVDADVGYQLLTKG